MFRTIACVGHRIRLKDELAMFSGFRRSAQARFASLVSDFTGLGYVQLTGSGAASFFVILKSLMKLSRRTEVVLPAYTAPSLVVAIRQAGLTPVLCDISLADFNAAYDDMLHRAGPTTLCAVPVHMFGIPWTRVLDLRHAVAPDVFVVEDGCQAFGAKVDGVHVGDAGDAAFFSFNRGKNLPTLTGGCVATSSQKFFDRLADEARTCLSTISGPKTLARAVKLLGLFFSFHPRGYALLRPVASLFKETAVPRAIALEHFTEFQASFGVSLWDGLEDAFKQRRSNGSFLLKALGSSQGVIVPTIEPNVTPVFNRLPVVIKDASVVEKVIAALGRRGIEASRFYCRPLHHIFDLGHDPREFPNAVYLAERLVTLPVHPLVEPRDLDEMVNTLKEFI